MVPDEEGEIDSFEEVLDVVEGTATREDVEDENRDTVGIRDMGEVVLGQPSSEHIDDPELFEDVNDDRQVLDELASSEGADSILPNHRSPSFKPPMQNPSSSILNPGNGCHVTRPSH